MNETKVDNVNHPHHYAESCSIECIDSMMVAFGPEAVYDFCVCNAYKYMWRYKNKNGKEDLSKTKWYLTKADGILNTYSIPRSAEKLEVLDKLYYQLLMKSQ